MVRWWEKLLPCMCKMTWKKKMEHDTIRGRVLPSVIFSAVPTSKHVLYKCHFSSVEKRTDRTREMNEHNRWASGAFLSFSMPKYVHYEFTRTFFIWTQTGRQRDGREENPHYCFFFPSPRARKSDEIDGRKAKQGEERRVGSSNQWTAYYGLGLGASLPWY